MCNSCRFPVALFTRVLNFLHLQKQNVTYITTYLKKKVLVVSCRTLCYFHKKYNKLAGKVAKDSLFIESVL